MGTFQDKYKIIQLWEEEAIKELDEFLSKVDEGFRHLIVKVDRTTNGGTDYFIGTSGSKVGWETHEEFSKLVKSILDKVRTLNTYGNIIHITPRGDIEEESLIYEEGLDKK